MRYPQHWLQLIKIMILHPLECMLFYIGFHTLVLKCFNSEMIEWKRFQNCEREFLWCDVVASSLVIPMEFANKVS